LLKRIKDKSDKPWFVAGDFNEAMFQFEHWSATKRSERRMKEFRETLDCCNLHDLGFLGCPWTFDNKQSGRNNVRVRLDRAVACPSWSQLYPHATVQHILPSCSDHCPILISLVKEENNQDHNPQRYEAMWEREPSFSECVEEAWGIDEKME
jgi:exonuclease III